MRQRAAARDADVPPALRRFPLDLSRMAGRLNTTASGLLPIRASRVGPEDERHTTRDGRSVAIRPGYLFAIERGWCVLVVENEQPVVLMPPESARRLAAVFRWHLAEALNGKAFHAASLTGGWDVVLFPSVLSEDAVFQRRSLPVPSQEIDSMMFRYRIACAEDASRDALLEWVAQADRAQGAISDLCDLIERDGRHHDGKPWPDLVALLADDKSEPGKLMRAYRREYSKAEKGPDRPSDAMRVFWQWASEGAPTGKTWRAHSGLLSDDMGPTADRDIVSPVEWLWMPSWSVMPDEMSQVVTLQYFDRLPTRSPAHDPIAVTLRGLCRQKDWLETAMTAAGAIIEVGQRWHRVPGDKGGRPADRPLRWLVQRAHGLDLTIDDLATLLVANRAVLPNWEGLTRGTIKKRLDRSWQSYLLAPPVVF